MNDFDNGFRLLEEAAKRILADFANHCSDKWQLTDKDSKEFTSDYRAGWNMAMKDGVRCAMKLYLDEADVRDD